MTVSDLIAALSAFPSEARVVVVARENFDDPHVHCAVARCDSGGFFGAHDEMEPFHASIEEVFVSPVATEAIVPVVVISNATSTLSDTETWTAASALAAEIRRAEHRVRESQDD
jgi:hypothetical protein